MRRQLASVLTFLVFALLPGLAYAFPADGSYTISSSGVTDTVTAPPAAA
jgi:hypothetical protein